jgi:ankyrin repeat protein
VYLVARKEDREIVDALLQHGARADIEVVESLLDTGTTALHEAAQTGDLRQVKRLLAAGMEANIPDGYGRCPVYLARAEHHMKVVEFLLPYTPATFITGMLSEAVENNSEEMIRFFLSHGADPNAQDPIRQASQLHLAAWGPNPKVLELLLDHGADVNATDRNGETALAKAVKGEHRANVAVLLSHGADTNIASTEYRHGGGRLPLHLALADEQVEIAEMLVRAGSNVNAVANWYGWAPLHMASGNEALFELMLAHGGQIDCRGTNGQTPLHKAATYGRDDIARYLIGKGASVDVQDDDGNTPLHVAAKRGHGVVCRVLYNCGANTAIRNKRGRLPLDYALASDLEDIVGLLERNAD